MNRSRATAPLVLLLALAAASCSNGGTDILTPPAGTETAWMSIAPHQCGPTPWEEAGQFIEDYYFGLGVTIYDSVTQQLNEQISCTGCACPRGDRIDVEIDAANVELLERDGFLLRPLFDASDCPALSAKFEIERGRIQSCTADNQCGLVLEGTSCGCTRDLVARRDAEPDRFLALLSVAGRGVCDLSLDTVTTCDCPPAEGFACIEGSCSWNYTP